MAGALIQLRQLARGGQNLVRIAALPAWGRRDCYEV